MQMTAAPLIYIAIFVAVVLLVEGLYLTIFGKSISLNNRVSRRLALLEKNQNREQVLEQLRKEMTQHMNVRGIPLYSMLAKKAQHANIAFSPQALVGVMALVSVVLVGLAMFSDMGIGPAISQHPKGDEPAFLDTAFTLDAARGVVLWLLTCAMAWPAAQLYAAPELLQLLPAAG